jgi:hypothetical protein
VPDVLSTSGEGFNSSWEYSALCQSASGASLLVADLREHPMNLTHTPVLVVRRFSRKEASGVQFPVSAPCGVGRLSRLTVKLPTSPCR